MVQILPRQSAPSYLMVFCQNKKISLTGVKEAFLGGPSHNAQFRKDCLRKYKLQSLSEDHVQTLTLPHMEILLQINMMVEYVSFQDQITEVTII